MLITDIIDDSFFDIIIMKKHYFIRLINQNPEKISICCDK